MACSTSSSRSRALQRCPRCGELGHACWMVKRYVSPIDGIEECSDMTATYIHSCYIKGSSRIVAYHKQRTSSIIFRRTAKGKSILGDGENKADILVQLRISHPHIRSLSPPPPRGNLRVPRQGYTSLSQVPRPQQSARSIYIPHTTRPTHTTNHSPVELSDLCDERWPD